MPKKENNSTNHTARIGEDFNEEITEIKEERLKNGRDKKMRSTAKLTNWLVRHDYWKKMKEDLMRLDMSRRGSAVMILFLYGFAIFFFLIFFGIAIFGFSTVNNVLKQNVSMGQVNLQEVNEETFGAITTAMLNQADTLALAVIIGMVILMLLNAHLFGDSNKLWIPADIMILIFVFILSVYLAQVYEILINSTDILRVYIDNMPKSSRFLLNLPSIVATIGALLMIVTYSRVNKEERRESNVLGFE